VSQLTSGMPIAVAADLVAWMVGGTLLLVWVLVFFARPRIAAVRAWRAQRALWIARLPEEYRPESSFVFMLTWFGAVVAAIAFARVSRSGSLALMVAVSIVFGIMFVRRESARQRRMIESARNRVRSMEPSEADALIGLLEKVHGPEFGTLRDSLHLDSTQ